MIRSTSDFNNPSNLNDQNENALTHCPNSNQSNNPKVRIHTENCKACGLCIAHCPKKVLARGTQINAMGYEATIVAFPDECIGCGLCFYSCPEPDAISVK